MFSLGEGGYSVLYQWFRAAVYDFSFENTAKIKFGFC